MFVRSYLSWGFFFFCWLILKFVVISIQSHDLQCDIFHRHIHIRFFFLVAVTKYPTKTTWGQQASFNSQFEGTVSGGREHGSRSLSQWSYCICIQEDREIKMTVLIPAPIPISILQSSSYTIYGTTHIECRVGLSSFNFWNHPHRDNMRCVLMVIISSIELAMKINWNTYHYIWLYWCSHCPHFSLLPVDVLHWFHVLSYPGIAGCSFADNGAWLFKSVGDYWMLLIASHTAVFTSTWHPCFEHIQISPNYSKTVIVLCEPVMGQSYSLFPSVLMYLLFLDTWLRKMHTQP